MNRYRPWLRRAALAAGLALATVASFGGAAAAAEAPAPFWASSVNGVQPATPASTLSALSLPAVTPSQIRERAESWLTAWNGGPVPYNTNALFNGYRRDCSGYVSMVLGLRGPGQVTGQLAGSATSTPISKSDLRFGDMLINPSPGGDGHVVLFDHWIDDNNYVGYEESGDGGTHHRRIPYPYFNGYPMSPYRYKNIQPDVTRPPLPDFSGDGVADLIGVSAGGHMQYYPNNSGSNAGHVPFAGTGLSIGDGWATYTALYTGDFSADRVSDLIAVTADGRMQYYPNNSGSNANHVPFAGGGVPDGAGWNAYAHLYVADFSADGVADLIGVTADGHMQYYPNFSGSNAGHVPFAGSGLPVGDGWNAYSSLYTADFSADGVADLIAVTADGDMQYYPNNSSTNADHVPFAGSGLPAGTGWNTYTNLYT